MHDVRSHPLSVALDLPHVGTCLTAAAEVFLPPADARPERQVVAFAYPGGGYARSYFDLRIPDRTGYSMARHLALRGWTVVTCDHLGVGDSSHPRPALLTPETLATANAQVVTAVMRALTGGGVADHVVGAASTVTLGIGHSMGGGLLTIQQARHRPFDGVALLGWSGVHTPNSAQATRAAGLTDAHLAPYERDADPFEPTRHHPGYAVVGRTGVQRYWYYRPDVPADVIAADEASAVEFPPCATDMNTPGIVAAEAAAIDVPVAIVMGERDLRLPGTDEDAAYPASPHITRLDVAGSGHCHNLATTRSSCWDSLLAWGRRVAADARHLDGRVPP